MPGGRGGGGAVTTEGTIPAGPAAQYPLSSTQWYIVLIHAVAEGGAIESYS